jgi:hypothetical protein
VPGARQPQQVRPCSCLWRRGRASRGVGRAWHRPGPAARASRLAPRRRGGSAAAHHRRRHPLGLLEDEAQAALRFPGVLAQAVGALAREERHGPLAHARHLPCGRPVARAPWQVTRHAGMEGGAAGKGQEVAGVCVCGCGAPGGALPTCQGAHEQRLAGAWGAVQEQAARRRDGQLCVQAGVLQRQQHHLAQLPDHVRVAAHLRARAAELAGGCRPGARASSPTGPAARARKNSRVPAAVHPAAVQPTARGR